MSNLSEPISREPWLDPRTGQVSRFWQRFLADLFLRTGGANAPSNIDLSVDMPEDSGVAELNAYVFDVQQATGLFPAHVTLTPEGDQQPQWQPMAREDFLEAQIRDLCEQMAQLTKQVEELKQGTVL